MKRPQLVSSGSLDRMVKAAEESWIHKDFQQSIETLERASRLDPGNFMILLMLGRYHGLRYNYIAAERCFEKAIRIAPAKSAALTMAGEKCRSFARQDMAERYFKQALEQNDVLPGAFVELAEIYERQHRLEDAAGLVDRALRLNGACGLALLARARLDRQAGRLEQAEKAVRSLLSQPDPGAPPSHERDTRIRGWYELGAILDRQKRFDEAMPAFVQAKSMLRLHAAQKIAELKANRACLKEMKENISAEILRRWLDFGAQLQPARRLALLGGHPRSGTTLLEQVLDSHPDIVSAEETEIFHDDVYPRLTRGLAPNAPLLSALESAPAAALQQARESYFRSVEAFLGEPVDSRWLIDKNPSLTILIPYLIRIFPEMKFLVALRDPRDVCLSVFMQPFLPLGQTSSAYLSLETTVEEYSALMGVWTTVAPLMKNQFLEVRYEDMVEDLESVARRTLDFLGVPWDPRVLGFDEHARKKTVRSPTYADVTKPVFKTAVGRWRNYQKHLEPYLDKLAPFAKAFGYE
jgi:tetratricopeptide (TPR) repeat protein